MHRLGVVRKIRFAFSTASRTLATYPRMDRSYGDAIAALNTLQTNFSVTETNKIANTESIPWMIECCQKIGYQPSDFNRLNPIHISGTKGKGSTSAFISSILIQYLPSSDQPNPRLRKIGLYTSPHLRFVRERIRINNEPISEKSFANYFFETWDRLETVGRNGKKFVKPPYFRFLTLMALHTYMSEGVDTAIFECGIGGEYDCTNIFVSPTVTGITSLGIDHVRMLGGTIEQIAWHKAGIMKTGAPAFTVLQPPAAQAVLEERAAAKSVDLHVVERDPCLTNITLGLAAVFQLSNASLAIRVASAHLLAVDPTHPLRMSPLPPEFVRGLQQVRWPGRCETRRENNIIWHIDGGHTLESIQAAASWFASSSTSLGPPPSAPQSRTRILIFNQQTRDANDLARILHAALVTALHDTHPFSHVVFCTNKTFRVAGFRPDLVSMNTNADAVNSLKVQNHLAAMWHQIDATARVEVVPSIEEAVNWAREVAAPADHEVAVLVTGSLHLVGGFLEVLETGGESGG